MSGTTVAAGENVEKTYFRRLFDVLGAKGTVVLATFPVTIAVLSVAPEAFDKGVAGLILAAAFVYAVFVDKHADKKDEIDSVGVSFVVVSLLYSVLSLTGIGFGWKSAFVASVLILGAVAYDYAFQGGVPEEIPDIQQAEEDVDPLTIDVVGFVVAEILLVYAILLATGWGSFANSPAFGSLAFLVYTGTAAAFAGYAVVTREVVVSRTSDEVHEILVGVLGDLRDIEQDILRKDIASKMRRASETLDGVKLPTNVEDEYGEVPAVISTRRPDRREAGISSKELLDKAAEDRFTGYVVHGDNVLVFRNGMLSKYYRSGEGEYGYEAADLEGETGDATFHSLDHPTLNDLDDITPKEEEVTDPEEIKEEMEAEEEEEEEEDDQMLDIGGEEINMDEMFQKADEIMDDLSE